MRVCAPARAYSRRTSTSMQDQRLVVLCGLVGSGKSTFARAVETTWPDEWVRCNQDELGNRKAVYAAAMKALASGKNVLLDRTNIDRRQRADWLELAAEFRRANPQRCLDVSLLYFDVPYAVRARASRTHTQECRDRLAQRLDHPTLKTPDAAYR